jgi:two-component system, LuxR family, response regulator FixJ
VQERTLAVPSSLASRECAKAEPAGRPLCAAAAAAEDSAAEAFYTAAAATVFVVDDNGGVRKSLRALLESAGLAVETYASGEEFLAAYDPEHPGCLVLDVRLRSGSGLDVQDELRRRKAILPIIVLTGHGDVQTSVRALKAGAFDFLQKPAPPSVLLERIGAAIDFDHQARAATTDRAAVSERLAHLTPRERQVMELLIAGKPSKEIAAALHVSVRTVEGHRRMVLLKVNVSSAAQLVRVVRGQCNA